MVDRVLPPKSDMASVSYDTNTNQIHITLENEGLWNNPTGGVLGKQSKHFTFEPSFYGYDSGLREFLEEKGIQAYQEASRLPNQ